MFQSNNLKKNSVLVIALLLMVFAAPLVHAAPSPWTEIEDYGDKTAAKMGFGLRNFALGWTEILTEPFAKDSNPVEGFFNGIGKAVGRTIGGAVHTVTYMVTSLDVPLPENGGNLWPYEDSK